MRASTGDPVSAGRQVMCPEGKFGTVEITGCGALRGAGGRAPFRGGHAFDV
jgi:hypothetical protein